MPNQNPIGAVFMNIEYPGPQWVLDHCRDADYITVTMLDDHRLAGRIEAESGVPYTVARLSKFEPYPGDGATPLQVHNSAVEIYNSVKNICNEAKNPNIHIQINCEQGFPSPVRLLMYTELMEISVSDRELTAGMTLCNAGSGIINSGFWGQANDWSRPEFQRYLKTLDEFRHVRLKNGSYAFTHGSHPYTSKYPWIAVNAGQHRIPSWEVGNKFKTGELHINWNLAQDHLGRELQGIYRSLNYRWDDQLLDWFPTDKTPKNSRGEYMQPPWIINTEGYIDDMADVRNVHPNIMVDGGGQFVKGYRSLFSQWERVWFKGVPAGTTHGRMAKWVWEVVDQPTGYVIGEQVFCAGDTGPWDMDNLTPKGVPDKDYFDEVIPYRNGIGLHFFSGGSLPPEVPEEPEEPEEPTDPEIPPVLSTILTPDEKIVFDHLTAALSKFLDLRGVSPIYTNAFAVAVQQATSIVLAQYTIRELTKASQK